MSFTIPDNDEAFNAAQATWMQTDINALVAGFGGDGVVNGCAVTAQGSPDMTVAVASGTVRIGAADVAVASGNVTITTADGTNPRIDLIVVNSSGTKSATAGTAAASPKAPDIPASSVLLAMVYVPASDTTIASNQIIDKRVMLGAVSKSGDTMTGDLTIAQASGSTILRIRKGSGDVGSLMFHDGVADRYEFYHYTPDNSFGFYDSIRARELFYVDASGNLDMMPGGGTFSISAKAFSIGGSTAISDAPASGEFLKGTGAGTAAWSALLSGDVTTALGFTPVNKAGDTMTGSLIVSPTDAATSAISIGGSNVNAPQLTIFGTLKASTAFKALLSVSAIIVPTAALTAGSDQLYGMLFLPSVRDNAGTSFNISQVYGQHARVDTAGSYTGTITTVRMFSAANPSKVAGSTMTNVYGYYCDAISAGGTANYAFYSAGSSTPSYFAGAVGFNRVSSIGGQVHVVAGSSSTRGLLVDGAASQSEDLQQWRDSSGNANALVAASGAATIRPRDAGTSTPTTALTLGHNSSGTPAAGYGTGLQFQSESTTTENRDMAAATVTWATATDASRKARLVVDVYDTAAREALRVEASGSAAMIGFLGATASAREAVAADATDLATAIALVNDLKAKLITKGLIS